MRRCLVIAISLMAACGAREAVPLADVPTPPDAAVDAAPDVLDIVADATAADAPVATAQDATSCFIGAAPAADAAVADVPMPDGQACPPSQAMMHDIMKGSPSLTIEVGALDRNADAYTAYPEGGWALLTHGTQGWMHVVIDVRVKLPEGSPDMVKAHIAQRMWAGCSALNKSNFSAVTLVRHGDAWLPAYEQQSVVPLSSSNSWQFCGSWVRLHVAVSVDATQQWGQVDRTVRLIDQIDTHPR